MTLSAKVRELWNRACKWDEIPPESKFVVFSVENPWAEVYNAAMIQFQKGMC
jgi:hypothetical protein